MADSPEMIEIANEYRRLQRQLEAKTSQLDALLQVNAEAGDFPTDFAGVQHRRYSIDFEFEAGDLNPQELEVTIETGTIFRCANVESFVRAIGTAADPFSGNDISIPVTLPWNARLSLFDFLWRIRDTGTDREWVNPAQPSLFLGGGYTAPLWLPRRNILGGGTSLFVEIDPFLNSAGGDATTFFSDGTVERYAVQVSFIGHQEPDQSAL